MIYKIEWEDIALAEKRRNENLYPAKGIAVGIILSVLLIIAVIAII